MCRGFGASVKFSAVLLSLGLLMTGCSKKSPPAEQKTDKTSPKTSPEKNGGNPAGSGSAARGTAPTGSGARSSVRKPIFGGQTAGSTGGDPFLSGPDNTAGKTAGQQTGRSAGSALQMLQQLQILVGQWRGVTRKSIAGARGIEEPHWQWDFSDPQRPALAFVSPSSSYLRKGRLTYLPENNEFRLTAETKDGQRKVYRGTFAEPVRDEPGEDGKTLERTFRLTFEQIEPPPKSLELNYRIDIQQVQNNRYYFIVHRKAGDTVREWDRVANQRQGTSFAAKLDDYGEKTCVVSQGLGTMTVSYKGRTYYVCCSGCKKAFEEDPEKWIASFEEWKRKNKK